MTSQELDALLRDTTNSIEALERRIGDIAKLMPGRLRLVAGTYQGERVLAKLKAELTKFDSRTGRWRD